jgi:hypothetical protein
MHPPIVRYLEHLTARGRSPHTVRAARTDLSRFVAWWESSRSRSFEPALVRHGDLRDRRSSRQRNEGAVPMRLPGRGGNLLFLDAPETVRDVASGISGPLDLGGERRGDAAHRESTERRGAW